MWVCVGLRVCVYIYVGCGVQECEGVLSMVPMGTEV